MNIIYITNARIPTEKAYGLQTVSMCRAFAQAGADLTLVIPKRANPIKEDLFSYYGIEKNFKVKYISIIDAIGQGRRFGFWITRLSYVWSLLRSALLKKSPNTIIFTRELLSGFLLRWRGHMVFYDMHGFPINWLLFWQAACRRLSGIVCTNQWKMEQCEKIFKIKPEKLLLARNGFDDVLFKQNWSKDQARSRLNLPKDRPIAVYSGHLLDWKGANLLPDLASRLKHVLFVLVGGTDTEVSKFLKKHGPIDNLMTLGQKPHQEIPVYLQAADVLVLPNSARASQRRFAVYSKYDTSPLKLFEYMAAGRPIVAPDLPSIGEILNDNNAVLARADDPDSFVESITSVLSNSELIERITSRAKRDVVKFSWSNRAKRIFEFIEKRCE